jgi:uncharacterized protein (TIGR02301 family)
MAAALAADARQSHNRSMTRIGRAFLGIAMALALAIPVAAQEGAEESAPATELPPPIYEDKLLRLAEILGSLSFLRDLCGETDGPTWRVEMRALLSAEDPGPERRQRLIARFNHGFETFNAVYRACTPSAQLAISRYLDEGAALSSDVRTRYSQ